MTSHFFTNPESMNYFHESFLVVFKGLQSFLKQTITLISIKNFYLIGKQRKFREKKIVKTCDEHITTYKNFTIKLALKADTTRKGS